MCPEFFNNSCKAFTPKIDVWALNTCLYIFLTNSFFFYRNDSKEMEKLILKQEFYWDEQKFGALSKETIDLLSLGYRKNPDLRPTMKEYLFHPAFLQFQ